MMLMFSCVQNVPTRNNFCLGPICVYSKPRVFSSADVGVRERQDGEATDASNRLQSERHEQLQLPASICRHALRRLEYSVIRCHATELRRLRQLASHDARHDGCSGATIRVASHPRFVRCSAVTYVYIIILIYIY